MFKVLLALIFTLNTYAKRDHSYVTYLSGNSYLLKSEEEHSFIGFEEVLNFLMSKAKKGINMQRYKGLGEMNPEQLWETTMDPSSRRLLKVVIEDNVSSDDTFTILMGDQVEPRREFIEDNAFSVSNLDV